VPRVAHVEILPRRGQSRPSKPVPDLLAPTHASLAREAAAAAAERRRLVAEGKLKPLPEPAQAAADRLYTDTAQRLRRAARLRLPKTDALKTGLSVPQPDLQSHGM